MDNNVTPYFYKNQFRSIILQFMHMFSWLQVNHAKPNQPQALTGVPVHYGLKDRVAAAIMAGNTQNSVMRVPSIAVYLAAFDLAPQHLKGYGVPTVSKHLPYGGAFPQDVKAIKYAQPTPVYLTFSVSIIASNLDEKFQIAEQILALFSRNYQVQLQTSESDIVANKILHVELTGIVPESNYPPGAERRVVSHDFQFRALAYLSAPAEISDNIIKTIQVRLAMLDTFDLTEEAASDIEGYVFNDIELINLRDE